MENKFGFYVSGNATTLKKFLLNEKKILIKQCKIIISDSPKDDELAKISNLNNIDLVFFDLKKLPKDQRNIELSFFILENFVSHNVDYGFIFGGRILKGELLTNYKNKLINFHPSILPLYKGIKAIDQAVEDNAFLYGNTAHLIDEDVDSGAIIMQNIIHRSLVTDYRDIIDNQIKMMTQIIKWINEDRFVVNNGNVLIRNGHYNCNYFIPEIE